MISCVEWIPKGVADPNPKRYELSKAERELLEQDANADDGADLEVPDNMEEIMEDTSKSTAADAGKDKQAGEMSAASIIASKPVDPNSLPKELRMDDYSDDEDGNDSNAIDDNVGNLLIGNPDSTGLGIDPTSGQIEEHLEVDNETDSESGDDGDQDDMLEDVPDTREFMPSDIKGLEAMSFGGAAGKGPDEFGLGLDDEDINDDDSDVDDTNLQPSDALVIVAKTQEEYASLEVNVYEETSGNLFVHHDIPLPSFPLCLTHGTINSDGEAGNYVAVGTFDPGIEIWNADVLNALEPSVILGGEDTSAADAQWSKSLGKKGRARPNMNSRNGLKAGSHTDAVMSLSWSTLHRQVIASGSADTTVKLWDVTKADDANGGVAATLTHHTDKVQSTAWHPTEGTILATGSYDRTVAIVDARSTDSCKKVKIPADCESIAWDPHQPHLLSAASEDGTVTCWDVRKFESGKPYWSFVAHEYGGCSDISYNPNIPGMLATCAIDKTVALWDTKEAGLTAGSSPITCGSKDMNVGKLYSVSFYQSSPWLLGCGGSGNQLALWNLHSEDVFRKRFGGRIENPEMQLPDPVEEERKTEDFEAMMAASDKAADEAKKNKSDFKKKKGKGKSKKKVHKKR
jgi:periodic tryptophan protein 1